MATPTERRLAMAENLNSDIPDLVEAAKRYYATEKASPFRKAGLARPTAAPDGWPRSETQGANGLNPHLARLKPASSRF
jgi:hypothetical protein